MSHNLKKPKGLILDFGGVVVETKALSGWEGEVVKSIQKIVDIDSERIYNDLVAGQTAAKLWRNAMSRPKFPPELTHEEFVLEFIAADWGDAAREALRSHVSEISYQVVYLAESRVTRNGMEELLLWCEKENIPVAISSNALCGQMHRDYLIEHKLDHYFKAEIYSDEAGVRKPNPLLVQKAADAIGIDVEECWYVGDHYDRDVLCGKRANAGASILMKVPNAATRPFKVYVEPDLIVQDPVELLEALKNAKG
ncbi:MAG: HAD family hydrolase [Campylobacteraceae bacterium]|nr:HAD family hydrolase [Campylobacteraceae bacterium]